MRNILFFLSAIIFICTGCKRDDDPKMPEGIPTVFEIHTDQPISTLTVVDKKDKKVIFPKNSIKVVKNYYDQSGNQIFQYSENIKVNIGDRIEFQIPTEKNRKIFKVAIYGNKFFDGFYEDNGNQVKVFVVPEKL